MRYVWVMTLLLTSFLAPVRAETALTPKEISEGWVLLFDGETTFGWKARGNANWAVKDGMIEANGEGDGMLATTTEFSDYEVKAECWIDKDTNSGVFLRAPQGDAEITPMN